MADTSFISKTTVIATAWLNQVNKWLFWGRRPNYAATTGSANAQVLTLETGSLYAAGSEADGDEFWFKAGFTNTGAMTLNVLPSGGTNTAVAVQLNGQALVGGEVQLGQLYKVQRLGTTWQLNSVKQLTDGLPLMVNAVDITKKVRLVLSGITTATTRLITVPDADTKLPIISATETIAPVTTKGDTWVATAADTLTRKAAPSDGYIRMADSAQSDGWQDVPYPLGMKNRLINPDGRIYQRAVAATADDTYFADRWYMLTQTDTVTPSVLADPEDGYPKGVRITQSQAVAQRFGFAQIIEGANCKDLRGQNGVLVPRIRASASQAIRYAILGWTSTEDSVTSDVVLDWTSASYTAGGFFLAANLSVLAVGSQTPSANTWTSLTALSAALGSSFNNIIVMVWTEGTAAQNFTLDFDYVQFERGSVATEFERRSFPQELEACERYYEKSYNYSTSPGAVTSVGAFIYWNGAGAGSTGEIETTYKFHTRKRATPTVTTYDLGGNTGKMTYYTSAGGASTNNQTRTQLFESETGVVLDTDSTTTKFGVGYHIVADAEL